MYISGIGKTKFGVLDKGLPELAYEAMYDAIEDSGIPITEIDAIYVGNFLGGILQNQLHMNSLISSLLPGLNIPIIRIETACSSSGAALHQAIISLSRYKNVLVLGVEKMNGIDNSLLTKGICAAGDCCMDQNNGLIFPAAYALVAKKHMEEYGTTADDLALVALKSHENANLNEKAHFYHKKVDLDMIKRSPIVCTPLRLFDCSPISDGAAALVVSREKRSKRDIKILASSLKTDTISLAQRKDITSFKATRLAAAEAYKEAGISAKDVDIAEVHDCFTISELVAMEDLGFCKPGESKDLVRKGETKLDGRIPIGTGGGLKANGHPIGATGASQICEIVAQLRGEAGKRQVKGANIGLAQNIGGVGGTCVIHILKKED